MKATGFVRRVDELGHVVIPMEIRRALNIKKGDPLEIYTDNDGGVIFRKYQSNIENIAGECARIVNQAILQHYILHLFVDDNKVTVITPRGKATAKCDPNDKFDLNIGAVVALSKLAYYKMPDGLNS